MVLLTSSAISMAISSAVVCAFTFLLFLSGYVLQQQTVRSLQEALHRPPEVRPTPTLPKAFQKQVIASSNPISDDLEIPQVFVPAAAEVANGDQYPDQIQVTLKPETGEPTMVSVQQQPDVSNPEAEVLKEDKAEKFLLPERLAYMLTIPQPSDLCSAVVFAKWQRKQNRLSPPPSIIFVYPATWETSTSTSFTSALELLREVQEELSIVYHPVMISTIWEGVGIEPQLLSEVQTLRWSYDRAIYLRSPGFALNNLKLDTILSSSSLKRSWVPLKAPSKRYPDVLMLSAAMGILAPRNDLRQLTVASSILTSSQLNDDKEIERIIGNAAYIYIDEASPQNYELEHRSFGTIFENFEREQHNLCFERGLLGGKGQHESETDFAEEVAL